MLLIDAKHLSSLLASLDRDGTVHGWTMTRSDNGTEFRNGSSGVELVTCLCSWPVGVAAPKHFSTLALRVPPLSTAYTKYLYVRKAACSGIESRSASSSESRLFAVTGRPAASRAPLAWAESSCMRSDSEMMPYHAGQP